MGKALETIIDRYVAGIMCQNARYDDGIRGITSQANYFGSNWKLCLSYIIAEAKSEESHIIRNESRRIVAREQKRT